MSELDYMNAIAGAANADEMATSTITQQWKATPLKAADIIKAAHAAPSSSFASSCAELLTADRACARLALRINDCGTMLGILYPTPNSVANCEA